MKRKDMVTDETVLYAITVNGQARPGYVLDTGNPAAAKKDIRVRRYWHWTDSDNDWLNEAPNLTGEGVKFDVQYVGTADVLCRWDVYCRNVKRERQAELDRRAEVERQHEANKQAELARLDAVAHLLPGDDSRAYLDISDMRYLIANDRGSDTRYSARHVLDLLERIVDTPSFIVSWCGGYDVPSYSSHRTEADAWEAAEHWASDMEEGDTIDVLKVKGDGVVERLERARS